jgi:regulatory protein
MADIKQSIQRWCALQERSSFEVTQKLVLWNIDKDTIPTIINELRAENFLNDERFAEDFARGKFRIKHWGKNKIRLSLQQKRVKQEYIDRAILKLDEEDYTESLKTLATKKYKLFPENLSTYEKKVKLYQFLLSKGFENALVRKAIEEAIAEHNVIA